MSNHVTISSKPILIHDGKQIRKGNLITKYYGVLFLRKIDQWVEVEDA